MKRRKLDPRRLAKAVHLTVEPDGDTWIVRGGSQPHRVAKLWGRLECSCPDRSIRGVECKHLLAVRLSCLQPGILEGLREIVKAA